MKKQYGFSLVEGLLIIIVLGIIGFAGYYVLNKQKENSASSSDTTKSETKVYNNNSSSSLLSQIKSDLLVYNPKSTEPSEDISVDVTSAEFDNTRVTTTSDLYLDYKPNDSFGTEEIIQEMVKTLNKYNLKETSSSPFFSSRYTYEDPDTLCLVTGNENFARLNCTSKVELEDLASMSESVINAYNESSTEKINESSTQLSIHYESTENSKQYVALLSAQNESDYINSILSKNSDKNWIKITNLTSNQGYEPISCTDLNDWQISLYKKLSVGITCL